MSDDYKALCDKLGFELRIYSSGEGTNSYEILYSNGEVVDPTDNEIKLWSALLSERERTAKLREAAHEYMKKASKELDNALEKCGWEYVKKTIERFGAASDKLVRLLEEGSKQ